MRAPGESSSSFRSGLSLDLDVREAFEAWDECYSDISALRSDYDAAMLLYDRREGPDPAALRARLKGLQADCDQLFFTLLKSAELRMRERYI